MTRKRFVKLAMSHGWTRNEANNLAKICVEHNIPYWVGCVPLSGHKVCGTENLVRFCFWAFSKNKGNET